MAKSNNNIITHGMSGEIGNMLVFRQVAGKTVVSTTPKASSKPATAAQTAHRRKFQQGIIYGKAADSDPTTKAAYGADAKPGQTAFNIAVGDFMNAPDIHGIDFSAYTGAIGDEISIQVSDDFAVAGVSVKIENSDATLVEEGDATLEAGTGKWIYTATARNATLAGDKITVEVTDTPGNRTAQTENL